MRISPIADRLRAADLRSTVRHAPVVDAATRCSAIEEADPDLDAEQLRAVADQALDDYDIDPTSHVAWYFDQWVAGDLRGEDFLAAVCQVAAS